MRIGERVHFFLEQKGKNQAQLAEYLGTSRSTINGWKQPNRNPSSELIVPICEFLGISVDEFLLKDGPGNLINPDNAPPEVKHAHKQLVQEWMEDYQLEVEKPQIFVVKEESDENSGDIAELLKNYKSLDLEGRTVVSATAYYELRRMEQSKIMEKKNEKQTNLDVHNKNLTPAEDDTETPLMWEFIVYFQPASAGTGMFLDSDDYDIMEFPINSVPINASFGVRVSGHSMEPKYSDGDIVFVRRQPSLETGEIGVFILNGDAYIKKLSNVKKSLRLVSLNPQFSPIFVGENDSFRVVGKVIGSIRN